MEILIITGLSGSGKSTLTESIIGLNRKHSGKKSFCNIFHKNQVLSKLFLFFSII